MVSGWTGALLAGAAYWRGDVKGLPGSVGAWWNRLATDSRRIEVDSQVPNRENLECVGSFGGTRWDPHRVSNQGCDRLADTMWLEFFLALSSTGVAVFAIANTLFDRADESYKLALENMRFLDERYRNRSDNHLDVRFRIPLGVVTFSPVVFQVPYRYIAVSDKWIPCFETRTLNSNWPASLNFVERFPLLTPRLRIAVGLRRFLKTFEGTVDPETMTRDEMDIAAHEDEFTHVAVQGFLEVLKARPLIWVRRLGIAMMIVGGVVGVYLAI